jgi:two-component system, NtrC family, sensor kinase
MDSEENALAESADSRLALLDELRQAALRAAISRVASVIGHLIGTPLNVITGRAALIRANPNGDSSAENARRIEEQVERLAHRIRRLIDYLTLPEPNSEPRTADKVVRDALALYAPIAAERGVHISLTSAEIPDATVEGTSALVVLTSLLSLALRVASKHQSVELSVERIERSGSNNLLFELRVPGLQAPRSRIDRLDPPEDDASTSTEHLQILSVCYAIARRQGGRLDVVALDDGKAAIRFECVPSP